jgi:hypothetical protein
MLDFGNLGSERDVALVLQYPVRPLCALSRTGARCAAPGGVPSATSLSMDAS